MPFVNANPEGNLGQFPWPHYQGEGGAVASLANAIAQQRINQTQNFQKTLAQSIQEMAAQRSANAALDQAPSMGLPDPGNLAGQGTYGLADYNSLAKQINDQKLRELQAQLWGAHADYYNQGGAKGAYDPYREEARNDRLQAQWDARHDRLTAQMRDLNKAAAKEAATNTALGKGGDPQYVNKPFSQSADMQAIQQQLDQMEKNPPGGGAGAGAGGGGAPPAVHQTPGAVLHQNGVTYVVDDNGIPQPQQ